MNLQTLLDSGKYSDLTLHCADKTWKVHCAILCTSSSVFAAMVDNGFKEAQTREIDLPGDEPEIVEKMLKFLYQKGYDDEREMEELSSKQIETVDPEDAEPSSAVSYSPWDLAHGREEPPEVVQVPRWSEKSLLVNAQMYIMGDKYNIEDLKKYSMGKYAEVVEHLWNSSSFSASARLLYDNAPQSDRLLRNVIAGTAKKNISTLIRKRDFEDVMVSHGDLAVDVLKMVLREEEMEPEIGFRKKRHRAKTGRIFTF